MTDLKLEQIAKLLKDNKGLEVISTEIIEIGREQFIHVKDAKSQEYSIQIYWIPGLESIENQKRLDAYMYDADDEGDGTYFTKLKKKFWDYSNQDKDEFIAEYFDDFTLEDYYFVKLEKFELSLQEWIDKNYNLKNPINKEMFLKIGIQILEAMQSIHKNNCTLPRENILQFFMIDSNLQVKLFYYEKSHYTTYSQIQKIFLQTLESNEIFYYPPKYLKSESKREVFCNQVTDLWSLAICLYYLSGASYMHILSYIQGLEEFQIKSQLGFEINFIFISLLALNQVRTRPPSVSCILTLLTDVETSLQEKQKPEDTTNNNNKDIMVNENSLEQYIFTLKSGVDLINSSKEDLQNTSESVFLKCIEMYSQNTQVYYYLGYLKYSHKKYIEATEYCNKAVEINSSNDNAFYILGACDDAISYPCSGKKTLDLYLEAVEINSYNEDAYLNLGLYYLDAYELHDAQSSFDWLLRFKPDSVDATVYQGITYARLDNEEISLSFYQQASELEPDNPKSYKCLYEYYSVFDSFNKSFMCLKRLLSLKAFINSDYGVLAQKFQSKGMFERALFYYQKTSQLQEISQDAQIKQLKKSL